MQAVLRLAVIRFGLEDGLDQQPGYLIYTKHNNTEHQVRLDFFGVHSPASGALRIRP